MTLFPQFLLEAFVYASLALSALSALALGALLVRDWRAGRLW